MTVETFRCFVALPLSDEVRSLLSSFTARARNLFPDYRFGAAENLHITLQFLGDVPRSMTRTLVDSLAHSAEGMSAFRIGCAEAGGFPERGAPRILHLAVTEGTERLISLANGTRRNLSELGFSDPKPFAPHITLGRERSGRNGPKVNVRSSWKDSYGRFLEEHIRQAEWEVEEILLMESVLGRQGPVYTQIGRARLGQ